ncbi:MAG: helix-turn-helix domain-containing protein [Deltaproteobacteria bacterium]|jgi:DNA-binding transcriptional regulator YiaG|nr:helix-turn-helix domain-containing protein [Deltaproteobacteria bacterium]
MPESTLTPTDKSISPKTITESPVPQPNVNLETLPFESSPAVIVRRRNGQESRLLLRENTEPSSDTPAPQEESLLTDDFTPPRKKRLPRLFSHRRKRASWVTVNLDDDGSHSDSDQSDFLKPRVQSSKRARGPKPVTISLLQDSELVSQGSQSLFDESFPSMEEPEGLVEKTPPKRRGGRPKKNPLDDLQKTSRELELQNRKRAERLKLAISYIQNSKEKMVRKDLRNSALALKEAALNISQKKRPFLHTKKEPIVKKGSKIKRASTNKRYPFPEIDFDHITGKSIKALRLYTGMTLDEFCDELNVKKPTVFRWENTRGPVFLYTPSLKALKKFYRALLRKYQR